MSTRFFTNRRDNTLIDKFAGVFSNNPDIRFFDALVGYFRSSGYFALRPHLANLEKIRILVGIDVDQRAALCQERGLLFDASAPSAIETFMADVKKDISESRYDAAVEAGILQFIEDVASKKVELRAHPSRRLHAKIYIFRPADYNEHKHGNVITGSSNLTDAGLGTGKGPANYEFNVLLSHYDDVVFATEEFDALWAEGVDVLPARLANLKEETYLNDTITPYELYLKFLIEYFGNGILFDPSATHDLPRSRNRPDRLRVVRRGLQGHEGRQRREGRTRTGKARPCPCCPCRARPSTSLLSQVASRRARNSQLVNKMRCHTLAAGMR